MTKSAEPRPRILVFDSGLGGLSIVGELSQANLDCDIYYVADTAFFPYGEKSDEILIDRIPAIISLAVKSSKANLVIIACNTASTLALDHVRTRLNVPVIGVVPAIKPAAALTKTGTIGLLATPNTVSRPYTDQLIADFAKGVNVVRHGAIGLAGTVEAMLGGGTLDDTILKASIDGLFGQSGGGDIDVVVLACTHYPHVKAQLDALAPHKVIWIDSGSAIAQRARVVLGVASDGNTRLVEAFTSGGGDSATARGLLNWGFEAIGLLG
jgi:glutamate racemase